MTDEIKSLIELKNRAKTKYKLDPSDGNRAKFKHLRNHCNKVCRNAQRRHIHKSVENGDPAKVWNFLKTLGVGKSDRNFLPNNINLNLLNCHFTSTVAFDVVNNIKANTLKTLSSLPTPNSPSFNFSQFSACDVKKIILSINSNAVGSDSISRAMYIPVLDTILPVLTKIFNISVSFGVFHTDWKDAQIIPLPKKPNPNSFSDYRPISILPFLSKVLERLVYIQLNQYLCKNELFNPLQSGFHSGHSTVTALVKITDDIRYNTDNRELTVLTLLDFSNAFNTVDHDILLALLRSLNISPAVIDWFRSYLLGRRQRLKIDDSFSSWCNTLAGVPQGGVLSPLLFSIFINSITQQLSSSYHLYADDLQIYTSASLSDIQRAIESTNADLSRIRDWSHSHGLVVNPAKTQVIIIGNPQLYSR